ncbi:tryptase beta-2 [Trichonephila clavipes]|nr:tryptase beta-2 [Trichonephila clavipes]
MELFKALLAEGYRGRLSGAKSIKRWHGMFEETGSVKDLFRSNKQIVCIQPALKAYNRCSDATCICQGSLLYPKCRGSRVPKKCYLDASLFSIKLLGKRQLEKEIRIKSIIPHPKFSFVKITNDVALLELEKPLKCTGKTSPICLPSKKMYKTGQKIYVAGWGKTKPEQEIKVGPQLLREGVMKEVKAENCMRPGLSKQTIRQYHCAVGTNQSSCHAMKEGRFVLGIFRSERMRVLYRSRQDYRLRVMLVLVHIDITPPHAPLPVFQRIGELTIPYSW